MGTENYVINRAVAKLLVMSAGLGHHIHDRRIACSLVHFRHYLVDFVTCNLPTLVSATHVLPYLCLTPLKLCLTPLRDCCFWSLVFEPKSI